MLPLASDEKRRAELRTDIVAPDRQLAQLAHEMDEADTDRADVATLADVTCRWHANARLRSRLLWACVLRRLAAAEDRGERCSGYSTCPDVTVRQRRRGIGGQVWRSSPVTT
jgi:hypothetical protein